LQLQSQKECIWISSSSSSSEPILNNGCFKYLRYYSFIRQLQRERTAYVE
jgi:hypothetical protein